MNEYMYYGASFIALTGITIAVLFILRRFFRHNLDEKQRSTIGTVFPFVTMTFAFFLGFAIATLWKMYNDADAFIARETDSLVIMYRLAAELPESRAFRKSLKDYAAAVRDDEWERMRNEESSEQAEALERQIWREAFNLKTGDARHQVILSNLIKSLVDLSAARRDRLLLVDGSLPSFMWFNLFVGCIFSIICVYLMTQGTRKVQIIVDAILIAMLVSNVYLIVLLNKPFSGAIRVSPKAFCLTCEKLDDLEKPQIADLKTR